MARRNARVTLSLRLSPLAAALVEEEAQEQGISKNQFISEAVIAHAAWQRGRRGEPIEPELLEVVEAVQRRENPDQEAGES